MKKNLVILFIVVFSTAGFTQTRTTEALHKNNSEALALFFYNNTLRMLNQSGNKEFDELIKDIEKMKFLVIEKKGIFGSADYKKLITGYKGEAFEAVMTSRFQGKSFDVFIKDKNNKTEGVVILVNDSASLFVLDIVGSVALDKITRLYSTLDENNDIAGKIQNFSNRSERWKKDENDN